MKKAARILLIIQIVACTALIATYIALGIAAINGAKIDTKPKDAGEAIGYIFVAFVMALYAALGLVVFMVMAALTLIPLIVSIVALVMLRGDTAGRRLKGIAITNIILCLYPLFLGIPIGVLMIKLNNQGNEAAEQAE